MTVAPAVMKAVVMAGPHRTELARVPRPEPEDGEVMVRIEGCGVCASSLPVWEGRPWFRYPLEPGAPGHEAWGTIESTGERVGLLSSHGFAEYEVAPVTHCVPLPHRLEGEPVPLEPVGCAVNVLRRTAVRRGTRVAVVGLGFLGSVVAALAEHLDADVVRVGRRDAPEGSFECVIECAGTQAALHSASALVGERGQLVLAGYHQDGPRTVDLQSWNWRGIDVINAHERDPGVRTDGMRAAAILLAVGALDLGSLLTHRFSLAQMNDAFAAAATRPAGFVKAWIAA